jgi:hypothetical protein
LATWVERYDGCMLKQLLAAGVVLGGALLAVATCSPQVADGAQEPAKEKPEKAGASKAKPSVAAPEKVFFIGHSLISDIPDMVAAFSASPPVKRFAFKEQFIPGAPLRWQWEEPERAKKPDYKSNFVPQFQAVYEAELASGEYDALVLVEGSPLGAEGAESESAEYLARFAALARKHNPEVRVLFYEPWACVDSGTPTGCEYDKQSPNRELAWRERLEADGKRWERVVELANERLGGAGRPIELIPVGRALGRLVDAIEAGEVEGFSNRRELFEDAVHLNAYAKYFAGLVTWAALFDASPVGRAAAPSDRWNRPYWNQPNWAGKVCAAPRPAAVRRMQEIAAASLKR